MTLTKEQADAMLEAAKPLMKWLAKNTHPHAKALVGSAHIELVEGIATRSTLEFVDDGPAD